MSDDDPWDFDWIPSDEEEAGVLLHSIRTKAVEFQTKLPSVKEKSAASVAAIHEANQKRLQADFIASKALEVEELQADFIALLARSILCFHEV
ncbi:hypothetical protein CLOP_g15980 [Closterium sp. NIES-67]|nr:hypothetical protein CLOP_g15980 [Closterium sp. NIES-67]